MNEKVNMALRWSPLIVAGAAWLFRLSPVIIVSLVLGYAMAWVQKYAIDNRPRKESFKVYENV